MSALAREGQAAERRVEPDRARAGCGVEIAVGRHGDAEARLPAPSGADDPEKAHDIGRDGRGQVPGQHLLEMALGQRVLALEEEGAGELQAEPDQPGIGDQRLAEGGNGLVEQRVALLLGARPPGRGERRHALAEHRADAGLQPRVGNLRRGRRGRLRVLGRGGQAGG